MGMSDDKKKEDEIEVDVSDSVPFSQTLLSLYQSIQDASSKEERGVLMMEFAEAFAEDHDDTDTELIEDCHDYFSEYAKAQVAFRHAAMKLSRIGLECIEQFLVQADITLISAPDDDDKGLN